MLNPGHSGHRKAIVRPSPDAQGTSRQGKQSLGRCPRAPVLPRCGSGDSGVFSWEPQQKPQGQPLGPPYAVPRGPQQPHLTAVSTRVALLRMSWLVLRSFSFRKGTTRLLSASVASSVRQAASVSRRSSWISSSSP